jgi:hypothetical protein
MSSGTWVKWWSSPLFWKIFITTIICMLICFLSIYFLNVWGLMIVFPSCGVAGYLIRRFIIKYLEGIYGKLE